MLITLCALTGEHVAELECEATDSVGSVQQRAASLRGTAAVLIRLLLQGTVLDTKDTLEDCGITGEVALQLVQEADVRLEALPAFSGVYKGTESENDGEVVFELHVDSISFAACPGADPGLCKGCDDATKCVAVRGEFYWKCLQLPLHTDDFDFEGSVAREVVWGELDTSTQRFELKGVAVEWSEDKARPGISMGKYQLHLSADGQSFTLSFDPLPHTSMDEANCTLQRLPDEEALSWRHGIEELKAQGGFAQSARQGDLWFFLQSMAAAGGWTSQIRQLGVTIFWQGEAGMRHASAPWLAIPRKDADGQADNELMVDQLLRLEAPLRTSSLRVEVYNRTDGIVETLAAGEIPPDRLFAVGGQTLHAISTDEELNHVVLAFHLVPVS